MVCEICTAHHSCTPPIHLKIVRALQTTLDYILMSGPAHLLNPCSSADAADNRIVIPSQGALFVIHHDRHENNMQDSGLSNNRLKQRK